MQKPLALAGAFALVAVGSATAVGSGVLSAGVAAAADATDAMLGRSPGQRGAVDYAKTKSKPRLAAVERSQRALPRVREAPTPPGAITSGSAFVPGAAPFFAEAPAAGPAVFSSEGPGGGVFAGGEPGGVIGFIPSSGSGLGGGGGGGIVIVVPPGETVPEGPPAVTPVPEPATWAMMVLGFATIGAAVRRRSRQCAHG